MLAVQQTIGLCVCVVQPSRGVGATQAVPPGAHTLPGSPAVPHSLASGPPRPL